jgi:UDP-N-acetylbacillosamine N-acetyltransferase
MNATRIYIFGAGGHGKVVSDILRMIGSCVVGFVDDAAHRYREPVLGLPVIGFDSLLEKYEHRDVTSVALGVGDNSARWQVAGRCRSNGVGILTAVHPDAMLSRFATVGLGTVAMPGAIVNADAELGLGVIINSGAIVGGGCAVGDYAHISPKAALGSGARIGDFAHVGLGAAVLPGIKVGARSVIGAGAVVVHDIPDGVVAMGVPARIYSRAGGRASANN